MVTEVGRCHGIRPVKCPFVEDMSVITRQETQCLLIKPTVMISLSDTTYLDLSIPLLEVNVSDV